MIVLTYPRPTREVKRVLAGVTGVKAPHGCRIARLVTRPAYRKRGFATLLVAAAGLLYPFAYVETRSAVGGGLFTDMGFRPLPRRTRHSPWRGIGFGLWMRSHLRRRA
jgi:GNAT superfamily N-acetyltransferase